ncbi:hypothetical protein A4X09_0g6452 [Tilletia walkeri]|uniref:Uncharacterized protein n=1 Tax=Tilletia walkeri TaxID=117179 RepID=A0A8X7T334_9BASI|nr:hypothetical protein A4X09_0g6452 [Tilletia walkeri]
MTNAIAAARVAARLRFPLLYLYLSWTFQREVATAKLQPIRKKNSSGSGGSSMPTPATTTTPFFYENPNILPGVIVSAALLTAGLSSGGSTFLYSVTGFTVFDRTSLDSSSDPAQEGSPLPTWTTVAIQKFEQTYWAHFAFTVLGVVLTCLWPVWPWSRTACAWILENVYGEEVQLKQAEDLSEPEPKKNEDEPTASAEGGATTTATERNLTGARNRTAPPATTSSGRMDNHDRMRSIIDELRVKNGALKKSIPGPGEPNSQDGWKSLCKKVEKELRDVDGEFRNCYRLWQTLCKAQDTQDRAAPDLKELCYPYAAALDLVANSYFDLYDKAPIKSNEAMTFLNKAAEVQMHAINQILRIFDTSHNMPNSVEVILVQSSDHYLQYVKRRLEVALPLPQDDQELSLSKIFAGLKRLRSSLPIWYWFLTDATVLTSRIGGLVSALALLYRHYILAATEWPLNTISITRLSKSQTTWKKRREDEDEDTRKARCDTVEAVQDWTIELFDEVQKPEDEGANPPPLPQGFPVVAVAETLWLAGIQLQQDGKNQEAQDKFQQARKLSQKLQLHTLMQTHIDTLQKEQTALDTFTQDNIKQINERQQEWDQHIDTVQKRLSEITLSASYCEQLWSIVSAVSGGLHSSLDSLYCQYVQTCFIWFHKLPPSETTAEALHVLNDAALFQRRRLEALLQGFDTPGCQTEKRKTDDLLFKGVDFYLKCLVTRFKIGLRMEINQELSPNKIFGCLQHLEKHLPDSYWGFTSTDRMSPDTPRIGKLLVLATTLYRHAIIIHPNEGKFEGPLDTFPITRVLNGRSERAYAAAPDAATRGVFKDVQDIQDWVLLLFDKIRKEWLIDAIREDLPSWIPLHAAADTFRLVGKRLQEAGKFDDAKVKLEQALKLFDMLRVEQAAQFQGNHADTIRLLARSEGGLVRLLARSEGGLDFDGIPAFYHFDICGQLPWPEERSRRRRYEKYSEEAYQEFSQLEFQQIGAWNGEHADAIRIRALSIMMKGRSRDRNIWDMSEIPKKMFDDLNIGIEESRNEPEWRYEAANSLLIQASLSCWWGLAIVDSAIVDSAIAACKRADYDSRHPGQMAFALYLWIEVYAASDPPTRHSKEEEIIRFFIAVPEDAAKEWRPVFRKILNGIYQRAANQWVDHQAPPRGLRSHLFEQPEKSLDQLVEHHWAMEYLFTLACDDHLMYRDRNIREATRLKKEAERLLEAFELHRVERGCQERSAADQFMSKVKELLRYDPASTTRPAAMALYDLLHRNKF